MSDKVSTFLIGVLLGMAVGFCWACLVKMEHQKDAIKHNAARYNATTGKFEWIERSDK